MKIILPKVYVQPSSIGVPLFFLAGPIMGGDDWQKDCCLELNKHLADFFAAVPCWWNQNHPLSPYFATSISNTFQRQLTWERFYLELAANRGIKHRKGCILFWLPAESKTHPRDDGQPYARDTYGELGAWRIRLSFNRHIKMVVGTEADFPGLDVILRNFKDDVGSQFEIFPTLAETVKAATALIR